MTSFNIKNYYQIKYNDDSLVSNTWYINDSMNHSYVLYSEFDGIDQIENKIVSQPPEITEWNVFDFSEYYNSKFSVDNNATPENPLVGNFEFYKTKINDDPYSLENNILLDLDGRILTFLIDNSGSMTWNDADRFRYDIVKSMVDRLNATYPSDISYNLLSFGGTPIKVNIVTFEETSPDTDKQPDAIISEKLSNENGISGIRVIRNENRFPNSPIDGVVVRDGLFDNIIDRNLSNNKTYYYGVYTYNSDYKFSSGKFVQLNTTGNTSPRGIANAKATVLVGTGVVSDDNTMGLWHFNDSSLFNNKKLISDYEMVCDFSGNDFTLTLNDIQVGKSFEQPYGNNYVRLNGDDSGIFASDANGTLSFNNDYLSFMGWFNIDRYSDTGSILFSRSTSSSFDYMGVISPSGLIGFSLDGINYVYSDSGVSLHKWEHISITIDLSLSVNHIKFYINGDLVGIKSLPSTVYDNSYMYFGIGSSKNPGIYDVLLGGVSDFSVHNKVLDEDYIGFYSVTNSYNILLDAIDSKASQSVTNIQDNGDRMSVISYIVPDDYDYVGGNIRIIGKNYEEPSTPNDGIVVYENTASSGENIIFQKIEYPPLSKFYYRIFTQNISGAYSPTESSPLFSIQIPFMSNDIFKLLDDPRPPLSPIYNLKIVEGNTVNYLHWDKAVDDRIAGIKIYASDEDYPTIPLDGENSDSNGRLIFEGTIDDVEFVHRDIENGIKQYYSVITVNRFGQVSAPSNVDGLPLSVNDNTQIPLENVSGLYYEFIDSNNIVLKWDPVFDTNQNIKTYFGNTVYIYAYVTNIFGESINYDSNISLDIDVSVVRSTKEQLDIFDNDANASFTDDESYDFFVSKNSDNIVQAVFRNVDNENILQFISSISGSIYVTANVPNVNYDESEGESADNPKYLFSYKSKPISIVFEDPLKVSLENRDKLTISKECKSSLGDATLDAVVGDLTKKTKKFDGLISNSNKNFALRTKIQFEQDSVDPNDLLIETAIYDLPNHDPCDELDFKTSSFAASNDITIQNNIDLLSEAITDPQTNQTETFTYFDLLISTPDVPKSAYVYVKISYLGYESVQRMYLLFDNPLKIDLNAAPPVPNGENIAEQIANVSFYDPSGAKENVRDGLVVGWRLIPKAGGKNRPFYSTEIIPGKVNGVFSSTNNGVARNVFFGPVSDVSVTTNADDLTEYSDISQAKINIGETYEIKAYVMFDGLYAEASEKLLIEPEDNVNNKQLFLMSMDEISNTLWADGEDYVKLEIAKDANMSNQSFASCFRKCVLDNDWQTYVLSDDQQIEIFVGKGYEIIWGDVVEEIDPYTGQKSLKLGKNSFVEQNKAIIGLSAFDNITNVYFRLNQTIPVPEKKESGGISSTISDLLNTKPKPLCECIGDTSEAETGEDFEGIVRGRTSVIVDSEGISLKGGGGADNGIPPTILYPKEPLQVDFLGILKDDDSISPNFITDGSTYNKLLFHVSFAGANVPDGTIVNCNIDSALSQSNISFVNSRIYTSIKFIDAYDANNALSYAILTINPVGDNEDIDDLIVAVCNYDKKGTVDREKGTCVRLSKAPDELEEESETLSGISTKTFVYNINDDTWSQMADLNSPRTNLTLEYNDDKLYAIGGISSQGSSNTVEIYDLANNEWIFGEAMVNRRFSHHSVVVDDYVYVLGGITYDQKNGFSILSSFERYDIVNDIWEYLGDMPYPCAFGVSDYINNGSNRRIFVLSGASSVNRENGSIDKFNDYIMSYNIDSGTWEAQEIVEDSKKYLYRRLGCGSMIKNDNIIVFAGAKQNINDVNNNKTISQILYNTLDSYRLDTSSMDIYSFNDFSTCPSPRHNFGYISNGDELYMLGGRNDKSNYTNIFENFNFASSPVSIDNSLSTIDIGLSLFGMNIATYPGLNSDGYNYNSDPHLFLVGGNQSGQNPGYLEIKTEIIPDSMKLKGKDYIDIIVDVCDDSGNPPKNEVKLLVTGALKDTSTLKEIQDTGGQSDDTITAESVGDLMLYPVVFENSSVMTHNGRAVISLKPRSEDVINNLTTLQDRSGVELSDDQEDSISSSAGALSNSFLSIEEGKARNLYSISVNISVSDDFYYGKTRDITISDSEGENSIEIDDSNSISTVDVSQYEQICTGKTVNLVFNELLYNQVINNDIIDAILNDSESFSIVSDAVEPSNDPIISCYNDESWLPEIYSLLKDSISTYSDFINELNRLSTSIPYGSSAIFDALNEAADILLNDNDTSSLNTLYMFTDNESNMSITSSDDAIININSTNANYISPVIVGNLSTAYPLTLSAKANISDTDDLNEIANKTGGQAVTILYSNFLDEIVDIFVGNAIGSMGYGTFSFEIDFGEIILLSDFKFLFSLFDNTNSIIDIWISSDGYQYNKIDDIFRGGDNTIDFMDIKIRSIKIKVTIITGFSLGNDSEYGIIPIGNVPSFDGFILNYGIIRKLYVYLNEELTTSSPLQVVFSTSDNDLYNNNIKFGFCNEDSHNWSDYSKGVSTAKRVHSRYVIPYRNVDNVNDKNIYEVLYPVDKYVYRMELGPLDIGSDVEIYEKNTDGSDDVLLDASEYKILYRMGYVAFSNRHFKDLYMIVSRKNKINMAIELSNDSVSDPLYIDGLGFLYNTNIDELPAPGDIIPEVYNVSITQNPLVYDKITLSYDYYDANFEDEDSNNRIIKWFVRGNYIPYLDNLTEWNDINNLNDILYQKVFSFSYNSSEDMIKKAMRAGESLLKPGDEVYCTIRVSDGNSLSDIVASDKTVVYSNEPFIENVKIYGSKNSLIHRNIVSEDNIVVEYDFYSDNNINNSYIKWFVNGEEYIEQSASNNDKKFILSNDGSSVFSNNNEIQGIIYPKSSDIEGAPLSTPLIVIGNTKPYIVDASITPVLPSEKQTLQLNYEFYDWDIDVIGDPTQFNNITIKWYKQSNRASSSSSSSSSSSWEEMVVYENEETIPIGATSSGEQWKVIIIPNDGLDNGEEFETDTVYIQK